MLRGSGKFSTVFAMSTNQWPEVITRSVNLCPRCGGVHQNVEFKVFQLGDPDFTHWSFCEASGEPLLLDMKETCKTRSKFDVKFISTGRSNTRPTNPAYPDGTRVELPDSVKPKCVAELPYPSPSSEIGAWRVECLACGSSLACWASGCADDPRSIELPCKNPKP